MNNALFPVGVYVFFGLFFLSSISEVILTGLKLKIPRMVVKPICLIFLLAMLFCYAITWELLPLYLALVFGLAGDVFLMGKGKKVFLSGGICFLLGHVFYLLMLGWMYRSSLNWVWYIAGVAIWLLLQLSGHFVWYRFSKSHLLSGVWMFYFATLMMIFVFALSLMIAGFGPWLFLIVIGLVFFMVSDTLIAANFVFGHKHINDIVLIATYYVAQGFLAWGYLLSFGTLS